ncbi:MAG: glycosyltransferase family 2 protein [Xenococcaceae cyanobacterium]
MNQNAKVSVIIPAYNTEKYIQKAIASVLAQTLKNLEIIVVDDCSTDDTINVVQSFNDPRLRLLLNSQNLGAGGARNRALEAARGKWIAVLDSDDWYAPERLERLVQVAEQKNADLVVDDLHLIEDGANSPWGTMIGESGKKITSIIEISAADFVYSSIEGTKDLKLGFSKPLFRRDFLLKHNIKYDPTIKVTQDFWIDMECFLHGASFFLVPEPYYFYVARPGSLVSSNKIKRVEDECRATNNFLKNHEYLDQNPQVLAALLKKQSETQKWLDYYRIVEPLKQGQLSTALLNMVQNPNFVNHLSSQIPKIVKRRLQSYWGSKGNNNQKSIFQKI